MMNGKNAFFSVLYKPGATKRQSWNAITGKLKAKPAMTEIRINTKNFSCGAVKINRGSSPRERRMSAIGSARNSKIGSAIVKHATIATKKATTLRMSRVRSSVRCSINGAALSSISASGAWDVSLMRHLRICFARLGSHRSQVLLRPLLPRPQPAQPAPPLRVFRLL